MPARPLIAATILIFTMAAAPAGAATLLGGGAIPGGRGTHDLWVGSTGVILRLADDAMRARATFRFTLHCGGRHSASDSTVRLRIRDGRLRGRQTWRNEHGFRLTTTIRGQVGPGVASGTLRARGDGPGPRCTARRRWQARVIGAPTAVDPTATTLYGAVRGLGGAVVRRVSDRVRLLADLRGRCRGRDIGGLNLSPPARLAPDGSFRRVERFRAREFGGVRLRWRVVSAGRIDVGAGVASGTIRARTHWRARGRVVGCSTTRRWSAVG